MKKRLLKIALLLLAVLTTGSVNAATETYDFTNIGQNKWTTGSTTAVTTGGNELKMLEIENYTFGNRFAVSRAGTEGPGGWCLKQYNTQNGLFSQYDDRYLSVLNLKDGDRVTVTWFSYNEAAGKLKFHTAPAVEGSVAAGDEVESGTTYTISTDKASVNLDFVTAKASSDPNIVIQNIVIETTQKVSVTIGNIDTTVRETANFGGHYNNAAPVAQTGYPITGTSKLYQLIAKDNAAGTETTNFNNRFATYERDDFNSFIFKNWNSDQYLQIQWQRYFVIMNLEVGQKVQVNFTSANSQTISVISAQEGTGATLSGSPSTITSGTEYTVTTAGNLWLQTTKNTKDDFVYISSVVITTPGTVTSIGGTTLVSTTPLDFTGSAVTAYYAKSASAGEVTFSPITKVAAGTPIYIKGNAGTYEIDDLEGDADDATGNLLKGMAYATTSLQSTNETKYYVFGVQDNTKGFYPVSTSSTFTSAAGKAYLQLNAGQAGAARSIRMIFGDGSDITGINTAVVEKETRDDAWYTLQGARVSKPAHGIYIKNGKKIFVK